MNRAGRVHDYRWLTSDAGARWLNRVAGDRGPLVAQTSRLRKELSAQRAHLVLQQVELRRRGRAKFVGADRMFFTPLGLEQATDQFVAAYKAARFPEGEPLADLCCGIGGDLVQLSYRGPVLAIDRDPVAAVLAEANVRALCAGDLRQPAVEVRVNDVTDFPVAEFAAWHLDPDRRAGRRRTTRVERYEPGLPVIRRLLDVSCNAAVKLAPAAKVPEEWSQQCELEWISRHRQCRQLVAWFGRLGQHPGRCRATILGGHKGDHSGPIRSLVGQPAVPLPTVGRIGRYLFEPDAAVLAAHLVGTLAVQHGLAAPAANVAYLTGDCPLDDPALACFEVTDVLPFDLRRLRRLLRSRGIGRLEIKKRGVPCHPEQLRRRLQLRGQSPAVLLVAPMGRAVTVIVARRR